MYVEFDKLSDDARLWVYPANRVLSPAEEKEIKARTAQFINTWTAHGANLQAACTILKNRFLLIGLDEHVAGATGCSIDASVHHVQQLMHDLGVDFFDRSLFVNEGEEVRTFSLPEVKAAVDSGKLTPESTVFNTTIQRKNQLQNEWQLPASRSWAKRYFKIHVNNN